MTSSDEVLDAIEKNRKILTDLLDDPQARGCAAASLDALERTHPLDLREAIVEIEQHQMPEAVHAMSYALDAAKRRVKESQFHNGDLA